MTRPAAPIDRSGGMSTTTRPAAPPTRAMTLPAPTASPYATRSAPTASYPQPAYRPESRPQIERDAARGAQSRAAMSQPALQRTPQPMPSGGGGVSRPSVPSVPFGGQGRGPGGGQGGGHGAGQGGTQGGGQMRHR
jgi:hypothetical protein